MNVKMTVNLQDYIKKLAGAKEAMEEWKDYITDMEANIIAELNEQGIEIPESGSVKMEGLTIVASKRRDWDQACLAEFAALHPDLAGAIFVREIKPATKEKIDRFLLSHNPAKEELIGCFEEKQNKPSFRVTCES